MKRIALLGSTGSIGCNALDVIARNHCACSIRSLSTGADIVTLERQIRRFRPQRVGVADEGAAVRLARHLKGQRHACEVLAGAEGIKELAADAAADTVLIAISGSAALAPLLSAVEASKRIALANKEALVMAGEIVMRRASARGAVIVPIDSEQSAIWQCLHGEERTALKRIYLTASGGPFWARKGVSLSDVSLKEVLRHPRWKMGRKISVDSANLMNKGLEVIEAMHLFKVVPRMIQVVIHPEAIIHSMVEFIDGVVMAQLSVADMRIPIQYALSFPARIKASYPCFDIFRLGQFRFFSPDVKRFPCLGLAYRAAQEGSTAPCVLNAANEVCVEAFLKGELPFGMIPRVIERVLSRHRGASRLDIAAVMAADRWARDEALKRIS